MSYQPLDIALEDLSANPDELSLQFDEDIDLDTVSINSNTSAVFDTIGKAASASPVHHTSLSEEIKNDPSNINTNRAPLKPQFLKNQCFIFCISIFITWLLAVIVYSNTNLRTATELWHNKASNVVTGFTDRNITLNSYSPSQQNLTLESYRKGRYRSQHKLVRWLSSSQYPKSHTEAARGFYLTKEHKSFVVRQVDSTYRKVILDTLQFEYENTFIYAENLILNPGHSVDNADVWHLVRLDSVTQWRHSSFALYWFWKPATNEFIPIGQAEKANEITESLKKIHFAEFDPSGKYVVYGCDHDLYYVALESLQTTRITATGSHNIFNGKPDWVYEEEVTASDRLLWWSPNLEFLIFASIDDTKVSEYSLDYYTSPNDIIMSYDNEIPDSEKGVSEYPKVLKLKYPKPGSQIPLISLFCFNMKIGETKKIESVSDEVVGDDFILYDASWIDSRNFMLKVTDRTSSIQEKKIYIPGDKLYLVSTIDSLSYGGWFEKSSPIVAISLKDKETMYLDRVVVDEIVQLALFDSPMSVAYSRLLGAVTLDSFLQYDNIEEIVYGMFGTDLNQTFGSMEISTGAFTALAREGVYDANFSPDAQFVNLKYMGPDEPWQKLFNAGLWAEHGVDFENSEPIDDAKALSATLKDTNLPTHIRSTISIGSGTGKVDLNIVEIFPPNFDKTNRYPLLVHAYGGPGSVTIDGTFGIDFQDVVSNELNTVILIIDPRGTARDNWAQKSYASGNIGYWEPRDITTITKQYIKTTGFIDEEKTAIWGWSYGGFTTLKTLEYDKGQTFKYGMAVAPVTNWLFYDSIYTERYMNLPKENKDYDTAKINDLASFSSVKRFIMMHGTADDNVHVQNTLWLMDQFNIADVDNYDVHFFPDSEHSIYHHNANKLVYEKLLWWLERAFTGYYDD